ncbi:DUF2288 domain-containing protein [Merismopedia glauca]|uniref:DUF2288 domain-containing protein n=1 Tax=Merismopedia glauca CCAP 1448/3 TaxID=1296344 RepID=A0A2T1C240_9CYAN|nr:DUF2288 domain-containing protein [Merismopedia glauca]PSB02183.1 DUF2288 domain-containing protein [Merismopedia glauca CCAP 1448/3]
MEDIKTQLAQDIAEIEWEVLIPHAQRDAIIIVDSGLSLLDVAVAIAKDDRMSVQHWISEALITKPSQQQLSDWNGQPEQKFTAVIVQPFVLICPI